MGSTARLAGATGRHRLSRPAKLTIAFLAAAGAVGLVATLYVLLQADASLRPRPPAVLAGVGVAMCTVGSLLLRFVRWQYVLRRLDVRLPTLESLGTFVGSFAFLPVPLYVGQLVARTRLGAASAAAGRGYLVIAFLLERALDVWVIAVLALPAVSRPGATVLLVLIVLGAVPAVRRRLVGAARVAIEWVLNEPVTLDERRVAQATGGRVLGLAAVMSFAAWTITALSLVPLTWAAGLRVAPLDGAAAAARAIMLGALSLVPLGVGVSGILLVRQLEALGGDPSGAAEVAFVFRAATVWLTVALGGVALLARHRRAQRHAAHDHFDDIDECYDAWLPLRYREHVVTKKTGPMIARLGSRAPGARGLDIGCGRGWYMRELRGTGARMVGVDTSWRQLAAARDHLGEPAPLAQGSVLQLPFRPGSFDFAYIVNVLHHLPTPAHQRQALGEIAAVVRPGGLVFVHEMNVINPLFRFYLGYVFPILKGIEEGHEPYMDPRRLAGVEGLEIAAVRFFTFVPDFVPGRLLPLLAAVERRLEATSLARYSAHFLAVYERTAAAAPASG